jgi:hypothetical protein
MKKIADGPREAVVLLAMAYLYFSIKYTKEPKRGHNRECEELSRSGHWTNLLNGRR